MTEYQIGEFFNVGNEVFKVVRAQGDDWRSCSICDLSDDVCNNMTCCGIFRKDNTYVAFIRYDEIGDER